MRKQFGPTYADSFAHDYVIAELGGRTVHEALAQGVETVEVWRAVCKALDVPAKLR